MSIVASYAALKGASTGDLRSLDVRAALQATIAASLEFTAAAEFVTLESKVPGKAYGMFAKEARTSRPINAALYRSDLTANELVKTIFGPIEEQDTLYLDQCLYTAAMSFPAACDLLKAGNQKSPGTFFEVFVAHLFASKFGVSPQTYVEVQSMGMQHRIPTDYIFELSSNRRIHLPIKISTRERVVQVWAHQKMLDGMMGAGRFRGILVCLAETNKQKEESVVEVCLPNQWAAYQMYIATMSRVYYLDPPIKYLSLRESYPHIQVWPLSKFLQESHNIPSAAWT